MAQCVSWPALQDGLKRLYLDQSEASASLSSPQLRSALSDSSSSYADSPDSAERRQRHAEEVHRLRTEIANAIRDIAQAPERYGFSLLQHAHLLHFL